MKPTRILAASVFAALPLAPLCAQAAKAEAATQENTQEKQKGAEGVRATPTGLKPGTKAKPKARTMSIRMRSKPAMRLVRGSAGKAPNQKELKEKFDAKLAEKWVTNAAWITDYDKAKATAGASGRQIFGYFTRSYAP
ncbi:MAG: hypothetical protein CMJ85_09730 [Planctomycetes bacterium]|jgi:hypothetical protein|nr:hypothetical protein [Planctomycetota bacterium]